VDHLGSLPDIFFKELFLINLRPVLLPQISFEAGVHYNNFALTKIQEEK
jgi:hypothetical protein